MVERSGVRKSVWLTALAMILLAATLLALARLIGSSLTATTVPEPPRARAVASATPVARLTGGPARRAAARPSPAPEPAPAAAGAPTPPPAAEPSFKVSPPGSEPSGIALFPPPGTDPPKVGIVVPDDFELPEGYLRHHQTTDDGQPLAPILMFHPDYEWLDERGAATRLPADRVVPPAMAPPGLAIELLEIPGPRAEPDPAR